MTNQTRTSAPSDGTDGRDAGGLRQLLLGDRVAERAVAWGVVGFLLVYFVTPVLTTSGLVGTQIGVDGATDAAVFGAVVVAVATGGAAGLAYRGRGLLPAIVLVFGPLSAVAVRSLDATIVGIPVAEQLGVALLGSLALGIGAYVFARAVALVGASPG